MITTTRVDLPAAPEYGWPGNNNRVAMLETGNIMPLISDSAVPPFAVVLGAAQRQGNEVRPPGSPAQPLNVEFDSAVGLLPNTNMTPADCFSQSVSIFETPDGNASKSAKGNELRGVAIAIDCTNRVVVRLP